MKWCVFRVCAKYAGVQTIVKIKATATERAGQASSKKSKGAGRP